MADEEESGARARHHFINAGDMGRRVPAGQGGAMIEDEEVRQPACPLKTLDPMSVADLRAYIAGLRAEIARAEGVIAAKEGARGLADSFFRK